MFIHGGDGDGVDDAADNCLDIANAAPLDCDSDHDGYGNVCDSDFDQNYVSNSGDYGNWFVPAFKGGIRSPWPQGQDMDCNGTVNSNDFGNYFVPKFNGLSAGGISPGPSGLSCAGTIPCPP